MNGKLPAFFERHPASDFVRVGRSNDGGYVVPEIDIQNCGALVSLGLCDDWSFEVDFVNLKAVPVIAYDASTNLRFLLKRGVIEFFKKPLGFYFFKKVLSYYTFFGSTNNRHVKKFVGLRSLDNLYISFSDVMSELQQNNIFLKIDIEGSEYRILDDLVAHADRICGMVIEFHDCDLHMARIESFIRKFNLNLVHVHANNYAPIREIDALPLAIELTFSKYSKDGGVSSLPLELDMPNDKRLSEVALLVG